MADAARLAAALREHLADLAHHQRCVAGRRQHLERSYRRLRSVYEGRAAGELDLHWQRTVRHLEDHEQGVRALTATLGERVAALEAAERTGGLGDP